MLKIVSVVKLVSFVKIIRFAKKRKTAENSFLARHFITRALLGAENFSQAQTILRDNGVGAGNGCSVNMTFLW